MKAGALGYLLKENLLSQLHLAITTVSDGKIYMSPDVATKFFQIFHGYEGQKNQEHDGVLPLLTNREREVLRLLVQGYSNEEIAQDLYITVATVKAHLTAIFEKLGVKSRSRAIVRSLHLGIV
jgi:DNA-binding NarL/FixJ family response regulator